VRRLVIALLLFAAHARADHQSDADQLTRDAIALGKSGNLEQAIQKFHAAQKLFPRPNNHCNIGLAYAQLARWAKAHLYLERCRNQVRAGLPEWVDKRLKQSEDGLKASLSAPVRVTSEPPGAQVLATGFDPEDELTTPVTLWLPLGEREIGAALPGYEPKQQRLKLDTVELQQLHLVLEKPKLVEPPLVTQAPTPAPVVVIAQRSPRLRVAGGVVTALGIASLGTSLALYLVAREVTTPDANGLVRGTREFDSALDRFHAQVNGSIAMLAVGGALTIAGVTVLALSARRR
jgi:hypothetical protein